MSYQNLKLSFLTVLLTASAILAQSPAASGGAPPRIRRLPETRAEIDRLEARFDAARALVEASGSESERADLEFLRTLDGTPSEDALDRLAASELPEARALLFRAAARPDLASLLIETMQGGLVDDETSRSVYRTLWVAANLAPQYNARTVDFIAFRHHRALIAERARAEELATWEYLALFGTVVDPQRPSSWDSRFAALVAIDAIAKRGGGTLPPSTVRVLGALLQLDAVDLGSDRVTKREAKELVLAALGRDASEAGLLALAGALSAPSVHLRTLVERALEDHRHPTKVDALTRARDAAPAGAPRRQVLDRALEVLGRPR